MDRKSVGTLKVKLYAGLEGAAPIDIGFVAVPLVVGSVNRFVVDVQEAAEYVSESFKAVFENGVPVNVFKIDRETGEWLTKTPMSSEEGARIAASVMPGWTPELVDALYSAWLSHDSLPAMSIEPVDVWQAGMEAGADWVANNPGPSGIPADPPRNPWED